MSELSITELTNYLDSFLESALFQEKTYNGLQVTTHAPIKKIATAVSVSREVITMAIEEKAQALIVHHGLFRKDDAHPLVGILHERVKLLLDNNIALLCYHLPLDAHRTIGNNWKAARDLGLQNLQPFLELGGIAIGVVGEIQEASFESFKLLIEQYYQRTAWEVKIKPTVKKVAIVSGGAERFLKEAALAGADCYITGRVDEPVWDDAHEHGISYIGVGHYGSETVGVKALAQHLEERFSIPSVFLKTENPF